MTRSVLITGASGGIGSALCERMRKDGFETIGIDIDATSAADIHYQVDLRHYERVLDVAKQVAARHALGAIVHNAAVQPIGSAGDNPLTVWSDALQVNLIAVDALLRGTRDNLAANSGSVVVVSSVHAHATTGGLTIYATTKAALEGWVRSAALDLGPEIRVNAVAPGAIDTPKLREGFARWGDESAEERKAVLRARTALGRIGEPSDVAAAVSFLIGEDARFITGAVLRVDGGAMARLGSE